MFSRTVPWNKPEYQPWYTFWWRCINNLLWKVGLSTHNLVAEIGFSAILISFGILYRNEPLKWYWKNKWGSHFKQKVLLPANSQCFSLVHFCHKRFETFLLLKLCVVPQLCFIKNAIGRKVHWLYTISTRLYSYIGINFIPKTYAISPQTIELRSQDQCTGVASILLL